MATVPPTMLKNLIALLVVVLMMLFPSVAQAKWQERIATWLTAELLKMPASHAPGEPREEYRGRVGEIATAFTEEAHVFANGTGWSWTELAAAGGVLWGSETLFDKRVHAGEAHPQWTQDHGLARCGMQVHVSGIVPQEVWEKLAGTGIDQTHLCAQYGLRVLIAQAKQCGVYFGQRASRRGVAMAFASYAYGGKCVPQDREWQRADRWLKVMATRPDNEKKTVPGYHRVGPKEIPPDVLAEARSLVKRIDPTFVGDTFNTEKAAVGDIYSSNPPYENMYKYVIEHHSDHKVGVSVLARDP